MTEIITFTPDYSTNKFAAQQLVIRLKQYYANKGHNVRVWLEKRVVPSATGEPVLTFYDIRSSIKFKVPQ